MSEQNCPELGCEAMHRYVDLDDLHGHIEDAQSKLAALLAAEEYPTEEDLLAVKADIDVAERIAARIVESARP